MTIQSLGNELAVKAIAKMQALEPRDRQDDIDTILGKSKALLKLNIEDDDIKAGLQAEVARVENFGSIPASVASTHTTKPAAPVASPTKVTRMTTQSATASDASAVRSHPNYTAYKTMAEKMLSKGCSSSDIIDCMQSTASPAPSPVVANPVASAASIRMAEAKAMARSVFGAQARAT